MYASDVFFCGGQSVQYNSKQSYNLQPQTGNRRYVNNITFGSSRWLMQAYSSTVLALPQIKSECPAVEPLYQKAPLRCEKKLRILFRSGRYAYVKSAPKCIISTPKIKKIFPDPTPQGACGASNPRLRRGLDAFGFSTPSPPLLRNPGSAPDCDQAPTFSPFRDIAPQR